MTQTHEERNAAKVQNSRTSWARHKAALEASGHKCTACEENCKATFVCLLCGEKKNVCSHLVGGFEARRPICVICDMRVSLPKEVFVLLMQKSYARKTKRGDV